MAFSERAPEWRDMTVGLAMPPPVEGGVVLSIEEQREMLYEMAESIDRWARAAHDRIANELDRLSVATP